MQALRETSKLLMTILFGHGIWVALHETFLHDCKDLSAVIGPLTIPIRYRVDIRDSPAY